MAPETTPSAGAATAPRRRRSSVVFTPQMDDIIRHYYDRKLRQPKLSIKRCLEKQLGIPGWRALRRARELGLSRTREKPWSRQELDLLEKNIWKTTDVIARIFRKAGFPRTPTAICLARKRRMGGVRQNLPFWSASQLALQFGVDSHQISRWIAHGYLRAEHRGTRRSDRQGGDSWAIYPQAVGEFVFRFPLEFDIRKVDQLWFMDLVADGAVAGGRRGVTAPVARRQDAAA